MTDYQYVKVSLATFGMLLAFVLVALWIEHSDHRAVENKGMTSQTCYEDSCDWWYEDDPYWDCNTMGNMRCGERDDLGR